MEADISTIWLKFSRKGRKPFLIGAVYCEHKLLNRHGPGPNVSGNYQEQRWRKTLEQWTSTQGAKEMLIAGDINLDHICWDNPEKSTSKGW